MFLAFLWFAVQIVIGLYATSTVSAVGYDAARRVASGEVDHGDRAAVAQAQDRAEGQARQQLGRFGQGVSFDWSGSDDRSVRLHLHATVPRTGFGRLVSRPIGLDVVDRTITVRVERVR